MTCGLSFMPFGFTSLAAGAYQNDYSTNNNHISVDDLKLVLLRSACGEINAGGFGHSGMWENVSQIV